MRHRPDAPGRGEGSHQTEERAGVKVRLPPITDVQVRFFFSHFPGSGSDLRVRNTAHRQSVHVSLFRRRRDGPEVPGGKIFHRESVLSEPNPIRSGHLHGVLSIPVSNQSV
jgi:hypothetical protein